MTTPHPDRDTVYAALELAVRAPSLHNSQPWRWHVGSNTVHLYCESSRHLPHTDPDGRDLLLSCGAALHHSVIAFGALGWRAVVHRLPNPTQPDHLAALELHRAAPAGADIALAAAIARRRTDRRRYSERTVGLDGIALMGARAARSGVTLRRLETTTEFRGLLESAVRTHVSDQEYVEELTAWSGRHASNDGVPEANTPQPDLSAAVPGRLFAGALPATSARVVEHPDNGVLIALGTATDDRAARLRAGEATSAVLLTATAQGLSSCLMSEPLEVAETRQGLRESAFDDRQFPQMLLRVGWPVDGASALPMTPRRPLAEVVRRLDGTPYR